MEFISADIEKLVEFEKDSEDAITEFADIIKKFEEINTTLVAKWEGHGLEAYKKETEHLLENIAGIQEILDAINNGVIKDTKEAYLKLDEELGEFNKNPTPGEGEGGK
jgi:uncharacterized protein YukE